MLALQRGLSFQTESASSSSTYIKLHAIPTVSTLIYRDPRSRAQEAPWDTNGRGTLHGGQKGDTAPDPCRTVAHSQARHNAYAQVTAARANTPSFIAYGLDQTDSTNLCPGAALYVVVLITAIISFLQEAQSAAIIECFQKLIPKRCCCVRNGSVVEIDATDRVYGKVVVLEDGTQIHADIRVITANEMKVDNSSPAGEQPQTRTPDFAKDKQGNLITQPLETSNIAFYTKPSGNGTGCVISTSDRTVIIQIAGLAAKTSNKAPPIALVIAAFTKPISAVAIFLGAAILVICLAFNLDPIKSAVLMIGIIVANVAEGRAGKAPRGRRHDPHGRQLRLDRQQRRGGPLHLRQPQEVNLLHADLEHPRRHPLPGFHRPRHPAAAVNHAHPVRRLWHRHKAGHLRWARRVPRRAHRRAPAASRGRAPARRPRGGACCCSSRARPAEAARMRSTSRRMCAASEWRT